jgi:hypothetical protein
MYGVTEVCYCNFYTSTKSGYGNEHKLSNWSREGEVGEKVADSVVLEKDSFTAFMMLLEVNIGTTRLGGRMTQFPTVNGLVLLAMQMFWSPRSN